MITEKQTTLYDRVVELTVQYLGPAAERFVVRQIQLHVGKEPSDLTEEDLEQLIDWIVSAISLLTDDTALIDEFSGRLSTLAKGGRP